MAPRIGVASVVQETNTFSPRPSTMDDFAVQGVDRGAAVASRFAGTNTEIGGAIGALEARGAVAVPLLHAWAMSSGPLRIEDRDEMAALLGAEIARAGPLDALVLSLHGALASEDGTSGDLALLRAARGALGAGKRVGVCLDLHANITKALCEEADVVVGYLTYPHVDQGETGARIAQFVLDGLDGKRRPVTRAAKRPMIVAPEAQGMDGPFGALRRLADAHVARGCLDVSLFPVQPWLDVDELGFGVTVTTDGDPGLASTVAEEVAEAAWARRHDFDVALETPEDAVALVRASTRRPVVLSESADSPTAGTPGDSPAMVRALLVEGVGLRACVSLVDPAAVSRCAELGVGENFVGEIGCAFERRFHVPVLFEGTITRLGGDAFPLTGPAFTGMSVSMGRYAVLRHDLLEVLVTELPAPTFDPQAYLVAGIDLASMDAIVVRSANLFRTGYAPITADAVFIDVGGASTPRLERLPFRRAPRPLYPLDR
ncbi:MAG: M81 family metallopeptidase [Actinomycetota bacterium]|nr:M81 family metallopeptidase [Actinomycetota bacterium]